MAAHNYTEFFKFSANAASCSYTNDRDTTRNKLEKRLRNLFSGLNLPEPQEDEFHWGAGNKGLVFMHKAGCVLRVVNNNEFPLLRHPHIMRPIGSVKLDVQTRLDVQFAGACPVDYYDFLEANQSYREGELGVIDSSPNNLCYTALKTDKFPKGVPVIFDPAMIHLPNFRFGEFILNAPPAPRDMEKTSTLTSPAVDMTPITGEIPDNQDIAYADLRDKFTAMFDLAIGPEDIKLDPKAVNDFWLSMKAATKDGRLNPSWMDKTAQDHCVSGYMNFKEMSALYDKRLGAHNPVFADTPER